MVDIKYLEGVEIFLGYSCNLNCEFCFQRELRKKFFIGKGFDTTYIKEFLKNSRSKNKKFLIFSGGEPTLREDLFELILYAKQIGFTNIKIHTNGYKIQNKKYLKELYNAGLTGVIISIHGVGKTQDEISGIKGNFLFLNRALKNIQEIMNKDNNFTLDTNTVICSKNLRTFIHIFLYLFRFKVQRSQIAYPVSLFKFSLDEKKQILLPYEKILPVIKKVLILSQKFGKKVVIQGFPYCVMIPKFWYFCEHDDDTEIESLSLLNYTLTRDATYDNVKFDKCKSCRFYNKCKGLPKDYYEVFGDSVITSIY